MKVRLTTDRAGPGFEQREGEVVDLPDREAKRLVSAGQAERIDGRTKETATRRATERAQR